MLRKLIFFFLGLCLIGGVAAATTADIGCPYTYHKAYMQVYDEGKYSQLAFRWDFSQEVQINKVALYRFYTYGSGGPYTIKVVNDDNGKPGDTVYAQNISWSENTPTRARSYIQLDQTFTLPANTYCWIVIDGRNVTSANSIQFATFDREALPLDGSIGIDYERWPTAGIVPGGTTWATSTTNSNYGMYGTPVMYLDNSLVGDGQFLINEATYREQGLGVDGQEITNAPTVPYKINDMKVRLYATGNYQNYPLYFVVLDENHNEIANRSINLSTLAPDDWTKQTISFDPVIEIGAGNSHIFCILKSPDTINAQVDGFQTRGVEYISSDVTYPYGSRYVTSIATGLRDISLEPSCMDAMMNFSITFGNESSTNDYFVSPVIGNDTYDGTTTVYPWKSLSYASEHLPDDSTLWLMPGTYTDMLTIENSNITVSSLSSNTTIDLGSTLTSGIKGEDVSNVIIDGINLTGVGASGAGISVYFTDGENILVSNCSIVNGCDGIRLRECNDSTAQDNYITNMSQHGIHIYNQISPIMHYRNNVLRNNVSNCGHNMIDLHSNTSDCRIADNDVYFTDEWSGIKNNVGIFLHNGNTPNTIVENNTVHHVGRFLELNNVNDCLIRNNNFYDGLTWGTSSSSRLLLEAVDGTVPLDPFGCDNVTFSGNTFNGVGYPYDFYHSGDLNAAFTDFTFEENTYIDIGNANFRKETTKDTTGFLFRNEVFTNFTLSWGENTISSGDLKIQSDSYNVYDNAGDSYYLNSGYSTIDIDDDVTDVWYGEYFEIPAPVANFTANNLTGDFPLRVEFTDTSTNSPTTWAWDFENDGVTDSTSQNPVCRYKTNGNYTVSLTASNGGGQDTETKATYIQVTGTHPDKKHFFVSWSNWFNTFIRQYFGGV